MSSSTPIDSLSSPRNDSTSVYVSSHADESIMEALGLFFGIGFLFIVLSLVLTFGTYWIIYEVFKYLFAK